ncbi:hypothetical protein KJ966_26160 [bacterium]|nr:hypothetical protein [bacterium]
MDIYKLILPLTAWLLMLLTCTFTSTLAISKNSSVTSFTFSDYQLSDGTDTLSGSRIGISYQRSFSKLWSYFFRLSNGSAVGKHKINGSSAELVANTTSITGGLHGSYNLDYNSNNVPDLIPYGGIGLTLQDYHYDFTYEGSKVGNTSGFGYGPLILFGITMSVSDSFSIIPGYYFETLYINTETGENHSLTSSGLTLAFVVRF